MKQLQQTITTLDIAEMLEVRHSDILTKLNGNKRSKGIIQILSERKISSADFFQESSYTDRQGKERPCYKVTKLGCDFLANKFSGEKGIVFTALYVKRFADMEQHITSQLQPALPQQETYLLKNTIGYICALFSNMIYYISNKQERGAIYGNGYKNKNVAC